MVRNCGSPEQLGPIKQRRRRCLLKKVIDQMMGLRENLWETRNLDIAFRNPMQELRFSTANVGTLVTGLLKLWICWIEVDVA